MFRNDRKSEETSRITGGDRSSFLIPCPFLEKGITSGVIQPTYVAGREHVISAYHRIYSEIHVLKALGHYISTKDSTGCILTAHAHVHILLIENYVILHNQHSAVGEAPS